MPAIEFQSDEMPKALTDCVKASVGSIFTTIVGTEPSFNGHDEEKKIGDGVVGIISFMGDVNWMLMLALPRESANKLATKFCGFDVDYDSPDMGDVVGELANVLAGDIVARLGQVEIKVAMSLPTILRGHDVEPLLPRGLPATKMHFTLPEGELMLKLAGAKPGESMGQKPGT